MNPFELARMRHVDLLAILYLKRPDITELQVAPYQLFNAKPRCSKESLVTLIMEEVSDADVL